MTSPRARKGTIFLGIAIVLAFIAGLAPMPYAIEKPGPYYNTLGMTTVTDAKGVKTVVPLISVSGGPSYPTTGNLDLLTVLLVGNPSSRPNFYQVLTSWFDPDRTVVPMDLVFPPNETQKQRDDENQAAMVDSQKEAIAAAFTQMGYHVTELTIDKVVSGSPAEGKLQAGDIMVSVNGAAIQTVSQLRAAIAKNGVAQPAQFVFTRAGVRHNAEITPELSSTSKNAVPVIKVLGSAVYHFPYQVTIKLDAVGGPSAGLMFSLGVYDKLTPNNLTGGRKIAGTGTIDSAGEVGPIGGIRQKMIGARDAGAQYMFVPVDNCDEAYGHVPAQMRAFSVATMSDALAALKVIALPDSDSSRAAALDALPTCKAPTSK